MLKRLQLLLVFLTFLIIKGTAAQSIDPLGRVTIFEAWPPAAMTKADGFAPDVMREVPADLHWLPLAKHGQPPGTEIALVQTSDGIVFYGRSPHEGGDWHIRWSTTTSLMLPPVGWYRLHGALATDADCDHLNLSPEDHAYCPEWRRNQLAFRARIRQAFCPELVVRDGVPQPTAKTTPPMSSGVFGQPIMRVTDIDPEPPGPIRHWQSSDHHYLAVAIPWQAWPWTSTLKLESVFLQAEFCPSEGACVEAAPGPESALRFPLPDSLALRPSPCDQDMDLGYLEDARYLKIADSLPGSHPSQAKVLRFANPSGGYLDRPDPNRTSPELWADDVYEQVHLDSPNEQWQICLPKWRLSNDADVNIEGMALSDQQVEDISMRFRDIPWDGTKHPYWQSDSPQFQAAIDEPIVGDQIPLDEHRILLVLPYHINPPRSGEGNNGACDSAAFSVWIVDVRKPMLRRAIALGGYGPDLCAGTGLLSAELSEDGRSVDSVHVDYLWDDAGEKQDFMKVTERYCLDDFSNTYLRCDRHAEPLYGE